MMSKSAEFESWSAKITSGQFAGIEAIFHQKDGEARSIMLVKMISQVVPISIENEALQARGRNFHIKKWYT